MSESVISRRPTLLGWLNVYSDIEREFVQALVDGGVAVGDRGAVSSDVSAARSRLRAKGATFRNGGASIVSGSLSQACVACTGDPGSRTFTLSTACNRSCYFCFNRNQADYEQTRSLKASWRDELEDFLESGCVTHVALTGGEPLLHADDVAEFFGRAHAACPDAHLRLYTSGDFLDERLLARLRDAGLRELRISVKVDSLDSPREAEGMVEEALRRVRLAQGFVPHVMVEMPVIPGTREAMQRLLSELDEAGAFGINLLEFGYPMGGWAEFGRRGFKVQNPPFSVMYDYAYAAGLPIEGSELLCLDLLEYAIDKGLSLGVHYCSLENKHRDQILQQNRAARLGPRLHELDEEDFFYKAVKAFDGDVPLVKRALVRQGVPFREDEEEPSLLFAPRHAGKVSDLPVVLALSRNVLEGSEGGLSVRELKLEILKGRGAMELKVEGEKKAWAVRAAMCELLAFSLRYPTSELGEAVVAGEWADAAEEVAVALELSLPEGFAADARADAGSGVDAALPAMRAEATRLFVGAPEPAVSPYEGVWRAADDGVQALLFVNPHSMVVERFCRACGLGRPEGTNEPLDHVATELELLQHLVSLEAGIVQPSSDGPALSELPGGSAAAAYEQFLEEHAIAWMPRFADAVAEKTSLPFYRAVASLLSAYLG